MSTPLLTALPLFLAAAPVEPLVSTSRVTGNVATGHTVRPTHDPCRVTGNLVFRSETREGKGGPVTHVIPWCRLEGNLLWPATKDLDAQSCTAGRLEKDVCTYHSRLSGPLTRTPAGFVPLKSGS